ncbi:MAG: SAM-dependent methyltransferase, partial [Aeromicrobium sp.]|nr:SAM-dependent methyltransferase [Aeromicrobium sp.]
MAQPSGDRLTCWVNIASKLLSLAEETLGLKLPIRLRAWDGSEAGVPGAPIVVIRSRRALQQVIWKPGELGVARAYVQGDLDVEGDLGEGLRAMWDAVRDARLADGTAGRPRIGPRQAV